MEMLSQVPKLLGISGVKNEQDVIEPFVRHNLQFLDRLIVLDNGSVDRTPEILEHLQQEFPALVVLHDDAFGNTQIERMNRLLHDGQRTHQPDFVVPLDADEFISATDRTEFCNALAAIPPGGYGVLAWQTFVITPDTVADCEADPPKLFQVRRREELPCYSKVILHTGGVAITDLELDFGSHNVCSSTGRQVPRVSLAPLKLMHFPLRSRDQFLSRIVVGWMANLTRDPNASASGLAWQKRDNFDRIVQGHAMDNVALCESSLRYAQEARPIDWQADVVAAKPLVMYERRYSDGKAMDAVQLIARAWEQSLRVRSDASLVPSTE